MITLGPHQIGPASAHSREWARHAGIVKQVDASDLLEAAPDECVRVFRAFFPSQSLTADPPAVASAILHGLKGYRHPRLYVEIYNELGETAAQIRLLDLVVPILHAAGLKVAGPSWATGAYTLADWQAFRAARWCGLDAIALHCYWGSGGFTPWHALRYRQFWQAGDPRVLITECGRDEVEQGGRGWRVSGVTPEQYIAELAAYSRAIAKDGALGVVYQEGSTDPQWAAFDVAGLDLDSLWNHGGAAMPDIPIKPPPVVDYDPNADPHVTGITDGELLRLAADVFRRAGQAWNPGSAIARKWLADWKAGKFRGAPGSPEHPSESGRYMLQEFASAVLVFDRQTGQVTDKLPLA